MNRETLEKLSVIDWLGCIDRLENHHKVCELLLILAKDLEEKKDILHEAYVQQDVKKMLYLLSYMMSGVCYLKLPQLEQALQACFEAIKKPVDQHRAK